MRGQAWRWLAGLAVIAGLTGPAMAQQGAPPPDVVPGCVMPDPRDLLPEGGTFEGLKTLVLPLGVGQNRLLYVGLSWTPLDGRVFVVNCATGKSLEEEMVGYIRRMEGGPLLPRLQRPIMLVATTDNQPTSREDTFKVIWFRNGKFETLLEHAALSRSTGKDPYEEAWTWKIEGVRVEFSGTRTIPGVGGRPAKREPLPVDAYCWGGKEFAKCD